MKQVVGWRAHTMVLYTLLPLSSPQEVRSHFLNSVHLISLQSKRGTRDIFIKLDSMEEVLINLLCDCAPLCSARVTALIGMSLPSSLTPLRCVGRAFRHRENRRWIDITEHDGQSGGGVRIRVWQQITWDDDEI